MRLNSSLKPIIDIYGVSPLWYCERLDHDVWLLFYILDSFIFFLFLKVCIVSSLHMSNLTVKIFVAQLQCWNDYVKMSLKVFLR